ncbi:hypothetical protein EJK49_0752 [Moraxella catarrhalis]|nr:hypothetical protein EJK49_0752 [Moraxella catarrhalis]
MIINYKVNHICKIIMTMMVNKKPKMMLWVFCQANLKL